MALFATATEALPRFLPEALGPIRNGLVPAHPAEYGPGGYPQHRGQTMSPPLGPARIGNMRSLPCFFSQSPDPRRTQGRRHRLSTVLGIAAGAVLCGMRGYKAIADGAQSLGQKSRERFGCRREQGHYVVPSESILRNVLIRVTPADLDRALQCWNERYGAGDESLAIDGKTMCNALDEQGQQTHVMSVVGHQTKTCYTQKKWAPCP